MFIGHFAPAFIAAAHVRDNDGMKTPGLGTFFIAAQLVDFGFFIFTLLGIEKMRIVPAFSAMNPMDLYFMPYTHSLLGTLVWALGFGLLIYAGTRHTRGAVLAGLVVLSHWFIDLVVHMPDLTLAGGDHKLGLGLWDHPWAAIVLELALIGGAIWYYALRTVRKPSRSRWPLPLMVALLLTAQIFNWFAPHPEKFTAQLPLSALTAYTLFAFFAIWLGNSRRHRHAQSGSILS